MLIHEFTCRNKDGLLIRGQQFCREDVEGAVPALIISHGFTSDMTRTRPYAEELAKDGYRVFIFDFCGGGFATISEGSFEDYMTPMTEVEDLKCVVREVEKRKDVSAIHLIGCSQGGFVSALVASAYKQRIASLILLYPALCIPDDARRGSMQIIHFDPNNIPDHVGSKPMRVSGEYPRSVLNMDVEQELRGYHGPVLIQHGTEDSIVPVSYAKTAKETYESNGNDVELVLMEGSDHGFEGHYFDESVAGIRTFLARVEK